MSIYKNRVKLIPIENDPMIPIEDNNVNYVYDS